MASNYGENFALKRGGLVTFQAGKRNSQPRSTLGTFLSGAGIKDINIKAAETFQAHVVATLRSMPLQRPDVSTGRLVKATADRRNAVADQFGWGVGSVKYLDQSIAKYWRTIEKGSAATWSRGGMRGMELYGVWGGTIQGYYTNRWGEQPRAAGPWRHLAVNGKLRGMSKGAAVQRKMTPMIVKNEILPHGYYADALETYNPTAEWSRKVAEYLTDAVNRSLTGDTRRRAWGPGYRG